MISEQGDWNGGSGHILAATLIGANVTKVSTAQLDGKLSSSSADLGRQWLVVMLSQSVDAVARAKNTFKMLRVLFTDAESKLRTPEVRTKRRSRLVEI